METILIADDDPTLVLTLKFNLERQGYAVVTAADGEKAVAVARETHPDLIVLDIMMPSLTGVEVCRILRKDTDAPILILSARVSETDQIAALEAGANGYVTKPFTMSKLIARIRSLLSKSGPATPNDE